MFLKDPIDAWGKQTDVSLAELAVRNHAVAMPFDRRGDVLYWDDFESPTAKYDTTIYGPGVGSIARSIDFCKTKDFSLKIVTDNSSADAYAGIDYEHTDFHVGKIGSQISFATQSTNFYVKLLMQYYDGTHRHDAAIKWDYDTGKAYYYTGAASTVELPGTYTYYRGYRNFATMKLVVDIENDKFDRLLLFNSEIDMSSYNTYSTAVATGRFLSTYFYIYNKTAASKTAYVDNYILTENEP